MFSDDPILNDTFGMTHRISISADSHSGRIVIPDAQLLLTASYKKVGTDLLLIGSDGKKVIVADYFKSSIHPDLTSADGTALSGDLVGRLAGPETAVRYAQATAAVIGQVERIAGTIIVQHANGVVVELSSGDPILRGNIVQTGYGSAASFSLINGTAFNLGAHDRMVFNGLIYDPDSRDNSADTQAPIDIFRSSLTITQPDETQSQDDQPDAPAFPHTNSPNPLLDQPSPKTEKLVSLLPFDDLSLNGSFSSSQKPGAAPAHLTDASLIQTPLPSSIIDFLFNGSNAPPSAVADIYAATLGHRLHISANGILGNDVGFDGATLSAKLMLDTFDGSLSVNADGSFDYRPYYYGTTTFTYVANDSVTNSNPATVTIHVAEGPDTLDISQATSNTLVMLDTASGIAFNSEFGLQKLTGINHVIAGFGNDTIVGNDNGDILNGGVGNDVIQGGSSSDILIGAAGNDSLTGGGGDDTFVFRPGFGHDVITDLSLTDDALDLRGLGFTSVFDILNHTDDGPNAVIHAGADNITLIGIDKASLAAHVFDIFGLDSYSSGYGSDYFSFVITVIVAPDIVDGSNGTNDDAYSATLGHNLHVSANGVLSNDLGFNGGAATASLNSDTTDGLLSLYSDGSFDYLPYFYGTTTFTYVANDGVTNSNPATVTISVAKGLDTFDVSWAKSNTLVLLDTTSGITFNSELGLLKLADINHVVGGFGNDTIIGNNNGGVLNGGAGNDVIQGGAGNDVLIGAIGNDTLTGGAGDDIFVFRSGFGHDTIADFQIGDALHHDSIDLRGLGFTSVLDILNHTDSGPSAVIHVGADDITLTGVDKALLAAYQSAILV